MDTPLIFGLVVKLIIPDHFGHGRRKWGAVGGRLCPPPQFWHTILKPHYSRGGAGYAPRPLRTPGLSEFPTALNSELSLNPNDSAALHFEVRYI